MQLNLTGQSVAVFGAARGIGRAIAEEFIREGCQVHGFDREDKPPQPSGSRLTTGDVVAFDEVRSFAQAIGDVDHVVYSVGAGSGKFGFPFWNLEPADWDRVWRDALAGAGGAAPALFAVCSTTR